MLRFKGFGLSTRGVFRVWSHHRHRQPEWQSGALFWICGSKVVALTGTGSRWVVGGRGFSSEKVSTSRNDDVFWKRRIRKLVRSVGRSLAQFMQTLGERSTRASGYGPCSVPCSERHTVGNPS